MQSKIYKHVAAGRDPGKSIRPQGAAVMPPPCFHMAIRTVKYVGPLEIPIAFARKKLYNVNKTTKKGRLEGCYQHPQPYAGD